jgi:hypothetical protein
MSQNNQFFLLTPFNEYFQDFLWDAIEKPKENAAKLLV